jgi:hypothetical protein
MAKLIREVAHGYHRTGHFKYGEVFIAVLLTIIGALLLLGLVWLTFPFVLNNAVLILFAVVAIVAAVAYFYTIRG